MSGEHEVAVPRGGRVCGESAQMVQGWWRVGRGDDCIFGPSGMSTEVAQPPEWVYCSHTISIPRAPTSPSSAPCVVKGEVSCSQAHWGHPLGKLRIGGGD